MRFYWPIAKVDAEQRMVWGYASTEAEDDQGEIVTRQALEDALDDYMLFANIREMHQPSAVGIATEATVDDKGLYLGARIVDGDAWQKVVEGVYKGFSIGGRVTARDAADRGVITGLRLTEISVVDRPANPEAVFDCWKLSAEPVPGDRHASLAWHTDNAVRKAIAEGDRLLRFVLDLDWLSEGIAGDVMLAADDKQRLQSLLAELRDGIRCLVTEGPLAAVAVAGNLRKRAEPEFAAGLAKLAGEIMPRLAALQQRVDDIARTPLPPQTASRGFSAISKREDAGALSIGGDDIVAALAQMSDEERTLTLIKAAHANPIMPIGWSPDVAMR